MLDCWLDAQLTGPCGASGQWTYGYHDLLPASIPYVTPTRFLASLAGATEGAVRQRTLSQGTAVGKEAM